MRGTSAGLDLMLAGPLGLARITPGTQRGTKAGCGRRAGSGSGVVIRATADHTIKMAL